MKRFLSSLCFLSILFIFISCEIGLGSSVDTEAPQLEIQNPSPDAIIRGAFRIGGIWSDDGTIETVTVKLSRTDGKGSEIEYQANFAESNDDSPNTWNCIINPQDSANTVLDGNYIAQVDITDGGKHTTTKTVQFAIDNTAPVIVLQRPSTKDDAQQLDSYGQKFTLEGQAADDNNVSLIEVQIYADKECTTLLHTVPLSNVPNSINLDVAEFKENVETDYSKIYGSTQKSGQKNFYCKVVAYDGAVYYPYDRTQTPEDLKGNKTSIYYLYEDIATAVLGEVKITDVYHILSGVYGLEKESSRSAETNSLIAKVKTALEKNVVNTGSFSLNPANNPTFSVSGKEPLQKDENGNVNFASGSYDITNGSQVIMEVTPGLDNIPLDGNSLKVYCIECDAKGTAKNGASKIYPATEMKKSGTTYKYTVSVKKQDGLVIGRNYLFGVDGYDEKKNNVVCSDNLGYGFHFSTSGAAPGLTILEPEAGSVTLANGKKLKISGTTTVEAGTPVITITDNKVNKTTLTFQESEATEDENKQLIYTFTTEIDFTGESAYHELEIVSDLEGIKTTRTKSVSYDSEKPVIAINSVNPIVEKTEPNGQLKKCLNGEVQISFSLTDDFSFIDTTTNKPYFELWQNNEKKYTATFTSTNSAVTETVTVDTNKLIDNTPLEIKVFTWDRAGNKAEYSDKQYQIDQSTDKPQITPKNNINFDLKSEEDIKKAGNNENRISMGGTVSFTVADDDGIDYIAVYSQTKDDQGKIITEDLVNRYPKEGSSKETQTPYSFILPSKSGYYLYRLEVKDIINTKTENNKQEYQFMIKATSPAPTIELKSEEDSSTNYDNNADGYIKAGGAFVNTITVESVESPFTLWEKIDTGEYKKVEDIKLENSEGKNYFKRKVSPIVTSTYYYKVEDSNEQYSSERSVKCKVDNDASTITPKSYPQTKQDTRVSQYTISGTAADTDSGVNKVYIAFANEDEKYSDWKEVGGTENWYYTLKYAEDDNFKEYFSQEKHGIKYIKFKVVDKVGWEYETQAIQFFYDTADPTVAITEYALGENGSFQTYIQGNLKIKEKLSLKGTATDDWEIETATLTQTFKTKQNESAEQQTEKSLTLTLELGADGSWEVAGLPRSFENAEKTNVESGEYEYVLEVTDKAGNETQTILNVEVDITEPVIKVNDLKGQNNNEFINTKNFSITGTIEESNLSIATAKLMKQDGSNNPVATGQISPDNDGSFSWKVYDVNDGEYTVEVYAKDDFGNEKTVTGSSFTVDTIAPVSTLTATENQVYDNTGTAVAELISGSTYYVKDKYTLSGTVTETNFKSAKLGEETLTASSGPWSKEITPNDETTKTQAITLEDKAGNKTVYTVYVSKDKSAPLLTVTSPTKGVNAASITVTGQVSDLGIGVESVTCSVYKTDGTSETQVGNTQTLRGVAGQFEFNKVTLDSEGKYKVKISAQDKLGNKTEETVIETVNDKTGPSIQTPGIGEAKIADYTKEGKTYRVYAKDTFYLTVKVSDALSKVSAVTAESGSVSTSLNQTDDGIYTGTVTVSLKEDGTASIKIKATDSCGNTSESVTDDIMVDKVAPDLTVTSAVPQITNKSFTVSGTVSDEIGTGDTPVIVKESAEKTYAVTVTDGTDENAGKKVWSFTVNPSQNGGDNSAADGNHTFTIEATDKAGNKASQSIEVVTDVTKPTVSISKTPDVNATEGTVYVFEGTANDGSGSGVSEIWMKFEENGTVFKASGTSSWLKSITFSEYSNVFNTSGEKKVFVMAKDRAENESNWISQDFIYDTKKPDAKISEYKIGDATNYTTLTSAGVKTGKAFSLKGIATDDWEVTSATLTQTFKPKQNEIGESLTLALELGTDGSWEVGNLPRSYEQGKQNETALNTGDYEYKLVVTDAAGKTTETTINAEVDTTAPVITVGDPTGLNGERFINTKNLTITGKIIESNFKTATAKLVKKDESNPVATGTIYDSGDFNWKVYEVADGEYTVEVYAIDIFGNDATKVTEKLFTVDTTAPVSTLTAAENTVYDNTGKAVAELTSGSTYYVKDKYTLSGTIKETNFNSMTLDGSSVTVTNNQWNAQITPSGETAETHTIVLEDKAGNKTVYTVYVAKDTSAPLLTVTSPTEGVNEASITVKGQVSDLGIGVESVSYELYKVEDTKETKIGETQTLTNKAGQFDFTPVVEDLTGDGKGEGKYKIKVTAQDKLGNKTKEEFINFMYDKSAPELSDAKITTDYIRNDYTVGSGEKYTVYAKDTFDIEVNVTDLVSGVNTVTAESGNTKVTLTKDEQGNGTGKYKGSITALLDDKNITTITIKATDFCNQTSTVSIKNIMVDKVAPTISNLNYPTTPQKDKFTISVSASDLIALAEVNPVKIKYKKNESDETLTMTLNNGVYEIELTPGTGTDSALVHYIPDGNHTFTIEATDKAGNKASQSIEVVTDVTKPTVSIRKTPDVNATEGTVFVFEGTADDGSGSGVSEILMKFGENGTAFKASGTSSWLKSITFSEYSNVFNTSGKKKVYVMAKDRAGNKSDWESQDFIYDTKKPDAKISEYKIEKADYKTLTSAGVKTGKAFSLKGSATDDWSVTSVKLTQKQDGKSPVEVYKKEYGETEKILTCDWDVTGLPRSFENAGDTNVVSGEYEYVLVVTDAAGKITETIINAEVDTTAPVITVGDPTGLNGERFINTKNLTITGKIIESNFKTATAKLVKDETSPVKNETLSPDQDGDFSWKVYEVADGEYTVGVYAKDDFGNENTVTGSSFTVDTTAPVSTLKATENQIYDDTGTAVAELTSGSTYYVKGDYRLSGTVTETNFKSAKLGEETLTASSGPWSKEITPSDETTKQQTIMLEDKAGNKTVYTVYVAKDTSAPLLTVTSPAEGSNTASITVTGQVSDLGIGVKSVSYELYKVEDTKETKIGETQTLTNKAGQFAFTSVDLTGDGKGEGKYKIKVTAQDKLGNETTETVVNFMYDKSAPELSDAKITTDYIRNDYTVGSDENQITYTVYAKDTFDIEVNAIDLVSGVNTVTAESGNTKVTLTEEKDEQGNGTGKYKGSITAQLDDKNTTTITIKATDFCNKTSTVSIENIMVDKVAPTISNLDYPTTPQKDKFTISVSASDVIALADAEDNPVKIKYKKNESDETLTMTLNNGVYEIELTPGTGTDSDSVHYIPDGNHTFTIEATDKAGNKASQSIEVVTDVTAPTWVTTPKISSKSAYTQETREYYKSNLININVKATDETSGVKEIVYKLDSAQNVSNGNANITLDGLSEGMHTVSIKAVDEAGNVSNDTILNFYIDTKSPLEPELMSIDSESGAALEGYINESKSKLVNGQSDVTFVLRARDDSSDTEYMSGIKSVEVLRIASNNVNITGQKVEGEGKDGQYTITIPANKLATGSVTVRITDNVGNTYEGTVFNLQLDNTRPVLKISSPAAGATVNKTITISGATTDNNAVAQTVVTVKKGETEVRKETFTAENSNELSWSLDLDTFIQNITNTEKTENLTITVTATDKAGNTASETRTITVAQDEDRPKISFNNVTLGNEMSSSDLDYYIWLKNTTKLYGTVEDDDGITSMQISNNGTNWHYVTLNTAKTSWSFDVKNFFGDETANKEAAANGAHTIYFKVTDALRKEFTSATSSSLNSVYLVDGEYKYGEIGTGSAKPDSVLYVKVDTLFPEVVLKGARIGTTGDFSNAYSNMTLGGAQRTMEFKLTAKDSNGIESVSGTAEFEFDGASVTLSSPKVTAYNAGDKKIEDGESDAEYYIVSFTVDLENENAQKGLDGKDGRISLKFTGEDKAGNSSAQTATINYDYKKPEVTITSPKDSNWVSGIVTAYGTIDSAATMYYALSPSDTITPAEPGADSSGGNITGQTAETETSDPHEVTTWSGIDPDELAEVTGSDITVTPKYSQIKGNGVQWFVYFDNQPSTELATHDVEFKKYLINSGITTKDAIDKKNFTTIVRLYLWVKSIDLAGNVTEEKFPILIDPQGDAPQVTISYPAKDGETLGGAVTLLGTASDTIGTKIGIKDVWVQIMSGTKESAATPSVDDVNLWIEKGYNVFTDIKNSTPTQVTSAIASSANPANYYIQANVSGSSWSLKINGNDEFSPSEGSTNNIVYRVYAQDKDNNLSKYQTQYSIFDADNPVLSDLYLRQYSDNKNGTGEITASRPYEDDMWIKGDWWLCGTVKDTQGIGSLKVGEESITVVGDENKEEKFQYEISTTGSYAGNKTISIVAEDKASPFHTTKKTCSINFDNKDPDSFEPVIANNIIQNRNGFFTFSAEVKEDAVSGAAQSGFKYLAFYFTRGDKVYDIMRPKDSKDSKDSKDDVNSAINTSGLTKGDDGLFWKELSITRDPKNLAIITLSAADANIHTGGLCKIGGSIYMIKNANGRTIELDGSPEIPADDTSPEDTPKALFAIANVVNNNIESGNGTKSTSEDSYGYFESISNDDGDHMVESVLKTGTTWKWEANINSRNIPDGEVTLHYVAFDAAGNYSAKEITGLKIANNAPRLASVKVWTDYNGNGKEDDNEHATKYYSKKTVVIDGKSQTKSQDLTSDLLLSGNDKDEANGGSAFMTIKAETKLIPELVGGNGKLYYTYRYKNSKEESWSEITKPNVSIGTGNDDGIDDEAGNGGYYVVDDENTAYISGTIYDGKTPGKNKDPIVITEGILGELENNKDNSDPTWFEYVIYDSTEGCVDWPSTSGRLSAKFKVALNVQYNDVVKPQVAVRPFYWNSKTDNSVCWDSTTGSALGHIELEGDLTESITTTLVDDPKTAVGDDPKTALGNDPKTALGNDPKIALGNDPKVSGKIKIEGYAFDNIKLKELYVKFDGHKDIGSKTLAATYTTSTSENTTSWVKSSTAAGIGNTWDFEATDVFNNSEGHLVYWTLTVDTQAVSDQTQVARLDQKVTVIAKDERGKKETITGGLESASSGTPGKQEKLWKDVKTYAGAATMFYTDSSCNTLVNADTSDNTKVYLQEKWEYQMDIVPYITGVKTSLSDLDANNPSVYNRTALGHYAVNATETVDIYGFNLTGGTLYDSATTPNSVSLETAKPNSSENAYGLSGAQYFSVSASTLKSGNIKIKVNEIPTLNNINKSEAKGTYLDSDTKYENHYNRTPNGLNNNLLEDDVIFDVWEFDSDAAVPISGQVRQPIMKISPATGMIQFAFANGPLYFSMGGGNYLDDTTSHDFWSQSYDFFTSIGYTVDDLGYTYGVCAGGDINDSSADVFALHSSRFGDPNVNRKKHGNMDNISGLGLEQIAQNGDKAGNGGYIFLKERIMSPSLGSTISDISTNLYLAYIDNINGEIRFKSGTTTSNGSTAAFGMFTDKYHSSSGITPGVYNINDVNVVDDSNSAEYLSLGVVPSTVTKTKDVVVLVWNEGTTLKYAYNESPLRSDTVGVNGVKTWKIESLPLGSGVGKYCKVAVDKKGGIHVAAYDQMKGDLKYAYRSGYKSGTWQTCTVDSYGIIGSEISLDVAMSGSGKPIPYISYYADSAVKPKLAYLNDVSSISDGATKDYFTQKWEVSYLPTSSIVPKDHINVGLWKNGSSGEIVDSMIEGSVDDNSFTNWQNKYGTYPGKGLVTKSEEPDRGKNNTNNSSYCYGYKFANGTKNPMVAYQVGSGVSSTIETAQMK